ncbi:MAG: YraN family protein [Clostridia bacterium]|nr:YraN family protein [Clostridia bacterium]
MTNNKILGNQGEGLAVKYLKKHRYKILFTQYRCRVGEVDIVAQAKDKTYVFVEVKTRNSLTKGLPREAVTPSKQRTIVKCAQLFVLDNKINGASIRFDVIEVTNGEINHIVDAFRP